MKISLLAAAAVILAGIALVLGYIILATPDRQTTQQPLSAQPTQTQPPPLPVEYDEELIAALKNWPSEDAPTEERTRHTDVLRAFAKDVEYLDVLADCVTTPRVVRVPYGKALTLRNQDVIAHTLADLDRPVLSASIPPGGTVEIIPSDNDISRDNEEGFFRYSCDGAPSAVGVIHIIP